MERGMRAGLYARCSTGRQDLGHQLDRLRQVAEQRGWVASEYADEGWSGAKDRRPALDRLMADANAGKLDAVVVTGFDRFARSVKHLVTALETFRALGVRFVSLREQVDTETPMGKAMFTIIAAMAELERGLIVERTRSGLERARRRGKRLGRPRAVVPEEIIRIRHERGESVRAIAKDLGVSPATVHRRLRFKKAPPGGDVQPRNDAGQETPNDDA